MVSSARQMIACIFFLLSAVMCLQSQTLPAKVSTASITGKVTLKNKGLAGIVVGLQRLDSGRQEGTAYQGVSDEQGIYRITNIQPGTYQILASAPAFVTKEELGRVKTLIVNKDDSIENIDFELVRGGVITGRVTDTDGRAIVEEEVVIAAVQEERQFSYRAFNGQTDDRGIYRVFGLPAGNYKVSVGRGDGRSFGRFGQTAYRQTYHPAAPDISQATTIAVAEGSEVANVDITVGRTLAAYSASGRIVDETGRPVPNQAYKLNMYYSQSSGSISNGAVTNQAGEFRFDNLNPGKYGVELEQTTDSDLRAEQTRFEISDQDITGLVLKTEKGASVSGVVVVEGSDEKDIQTKLSRASVYAWVEQPGAQSESMRGARINRDGTFRIVGLQSGLVHLVVNSEDQLRMVRMEHERVVNNNGIELRERETVNGVRVVVNHAGGSISGVVKLENGPVPPGSYVYVSLRFLRESSDPMSRSDYSAQADARGQFFFNSLLPGAYEVNATRYDPKSQGQMTRAKQQVVVSNGAVTNVTLTLEPATARP
jgi:protocatechuate 3,4-dioxygenase beta subunit